MPRQPRKRPVWRFNRAIVFGEPFEKIPSEVQSIVERIGTFQSHDRAKCLRVVTKSAKHGHRF